LEHTKTNFGRFCTSLLGKILLGFNWDHHLYYDWYKCIYTLVTILCTWLFDIWYLSSDSSNLSITPTQNGIRLISYLTEYLSDKFLIYLMIGISLNTTTLKAKDETQYHRH